MTRDEAKSVSEADTVFRLSTANCIIESRRVAASTIGRLDGMAIEARVLKRTLRVLSVHKLVEDGAEFTWGEHGAWLRHGDHWRELDVQAGVPLLGLDR